MRISNGLGKQLVVRMALIFILVVTAIFCGDTVIDYGENSFDDFERQIHRLLKFGRRKGAANAHHHHYDMYGWHGGDRMDGPLVER